MPGLPELEHPYSWKYSDRNRAWYLFRDDYIFPLLTLNLVTVDTLSSEQLEELVRDAILHYMGG